MRGFNPPLDEYPPPKEDEPALHRAARIGDCDEIRRLVAAGHRLDATFNTELDPGAYERQATPFMMAAGSSDGASVDTLRVLLELGADAKTEIDGRSAATFACHGLACWHKPGGDAARLRFVIQSGCPLPADPEEANELLCDAAATGDPERVRVLLEHGLNARGHWDAEKTVAKLRAAREHLCSDPEIQPDPSKENSDVLSTAAEESQRQWDERMFQLQSSAPSRYEIPLFRAAESGNAECVRALIAAGADPQARDYTRRTAMFHAKSVEVVRTLLQAGLLLDEVDEYGHSPLYDAVSDGESALPRIRALIEAGANVNATSSYGYTAFMSAVGSGRYPELLRLLVQGGANPHALSEHGNNAFHAALDVDFEANAEESVRDTLGYLKELGVNIEHRNMSGQTPLAFAIEHGSGCEVCVLCELGADANAVCPMYERSENPWTRIDRPLLFHAAGGIGVHRDEKVGALLKAGANPLAMDEDGYTPLAYVVGALCSDAADYEASCTALFKGLGQLQVEGKPMPSSRTEFVAEAEPIIRTFVEQFAREIPVSEESKFAQSWREEYISCIVSLFAYEGWEYHNPRSQDPLNPGKS